MVKSRAEFKKAVLERDNYKCLMCGHEGAYGTLDADHVAGRKSVIDDCREAGATICKFPWGLCHILKTDGHEKWKESQLPDEVIKFIEWRKWPLWEGIIWDQQ